MTRRPSPWRPWRGGDGSGACAGAERLELLVSSRCDNGVLVAVWKPCYWRYRPCWSRCPALPWRPSAVELRRQWFGPPAGGGGDRLDPARRSLILHVRGPAPSSLRLRGRGIDLLTPWIHPVPEKHAPALSAGRGPWGLAGAAARRAGSSARRRTRRGFGSSSALAEMGGCSLFLAWPGRRSRRLGDYFEMGSRKRAHPVVQPVLPEPGIAVDDQASSPGNFMRE